MEALIFYVLGAVTVVSAFLVVFLRRPLHNVLFMILTMIGLAGLFVLLHAEFVAMVQLIVYAGAVMVLFLFVIMLLNLDVWSLADDPRAIRWWVGIGLAVAMTALIIAKIQSFRPASGGASLPPGSEGAISNTELVAKELFTTYLLPFEIASVLLLAAIMGAVLLTRKK
jgi:NADH-quinone oxidoreductase subunit J